MCVTSEGRHVSVYYGPRVPVHAKHQSSPIDWPHRCFVYIRAYTSLKDDAGERWKCKGREVEVKHGQRHRRAREAER